MIDRAITVSILTVVRNDAKGLLSTIESVKRQRLTSSVNLRHVVVDGASTDGTVDVIKMNHEHIQIWSSERDDGIYDAMNKAAAYADPDSFLIWINAGDELDNISDIICAEDNQNTDVIFAGVTLPNGHIVKPRIILPYDARGVFPGSIFRHQGFLIRAACFRKLGGYRLDVGIQAELLLMSQAIRQFNFVESQLSVARFMLDGISNADYRSGFKSYLHVMRELEIPFRSLLKHHGLFVAKTLLKMVLPRKLTSWIIARRWGTSG
jgi:glycosyltransferase involved in cell wall biosynthesis